jgi:hypothetical protein
MGGEKMTAMWVYLDKSSQLLNKLSNLLIIFENKRGWREKKKVK